MCQIIFLHTFLRRNFNPLPDNNFLDWTRLKAFADNKLNAGNLKISVFEMLETLWEKEKMLVTSIFSFSHNVFKSHLFQGCQKSGLCGEELNDSFFQNRNYKEFSIKYLQRQDNFLWEGLPALSPFHTMFSKSSFYSWVIKSWECEVMGQM